MPNCFHEKDVMENSLYFLTAHSLPPPYMFASRHLHTFGVHAQPLDDGGDLPPWTTQSRYVSPLLVAYEARLKELEVSNHAAQVQCVCLDLLLRIGRYLVVCFCCSWFGHFFCFSMTWWVSRF